MFVSITYSFHFASSAPIALNVLCHFGIEFSTSFCLTMSKHIGENQQTRGIPCGFRWTWAWQGRTTVTARASVRETIFKNMCRTLVLNGKDKLVSCWFILTHWTGPYMHICIFILLLIIAKVDARTFIAPRYVQWHLFLKKVFNKLLLNYEKALCTESNHSVKLIWTCILSGISDILCMLTGSQFSKYTLYIC